MDTGGAAEEGVMWGNRPVFFRGVVTVVAKLLNSSNTMSPCSGRRIISSGVSFAEWEGYMSVSILMLQAFSIRADADS